MTSTQAVGKVRWLFGAKKAGHAGTLDPLATGILPIALGEATKTVPAVQDGTKVYRFTLQLGRRDHHRRRRGRDRRHLRPPPGRGRYPAPCCRASPARSCRPRPPSRPSRSMASGPTTWRGPARPWCWSRGRWSSRASCSLRHDEDQSEFEMTCEKGTYVRALARDLAEALGTRGHVTRLHRAAVGAFTDARAVSLDALEATPPEARDALLLPVAAGLSDLPELRMSPEQANAIRHGNPVLLTGAGAPIHLGEAWASCGGAALAVGVVEARPVQAAAGAGLASDRKVLPPGVEPASRPSPVASTIGRPMAAYDRTGYGKHCRGQDRRRCQARRAQGAPDRPLPAHPGAGRAGAGLRLFGDPAAAQQRGAGTGGRDADDRHGPLDRADGRARDRRQHHHAQGAGHHAGAARG